MNDLTPRQAALAYGVLCGIAVICTAKAIADGSPMALITGMVAIWSCGHAVLYWKSSD